MKQLSLFGLTIAALWAVFGVCACDNSNDDTATPDKEPAVFNYAVIVESSYQDSLATAEALNASLKAFVETPNQETLSSAKAAWKASREPYLQTEVYRFYGGPIDNEENGPEGLLNAWPLDENHIDYVANGDGTNDWTGFVNGTDEISAASVEAHNEAGGESNVATGYHAIEFLLWGQDLTDPAENKPGQRSFQDYVDGGDAQNAERRGAYLLVAGDLLVANLQQVHQEWAVGGAYRASFEADADQAFENILTGMTILSGFETGGERLQAALDSGEQEDEHSCFSDNTHRDMIQDVQGVWNVWTGTYTKVDGTQISGTSIKSVVEEVAPELAASLDSRISTSLQLANAMQVPFDLAIATSNAEGRVGVQALVESLLIQESLLEDVFDAFQLEVPVAE